MKMQQFDIKKTEYQASFRRAVPDKSEKEITVIAECNTKHDKWYSTKCEKVTNYPWHFSNWRHKC